MQIIVKDFSHHLSIIEIKQKYKLNKKFFFQCVSEATVRKVVKNLPSDKATAGEIPVNVLKYSEICFFDLTYCIKEVTRTNKFPDSVYKNMTLVIKPIMDQSVFYHYYLKYLKTLFMTSFMNIWKTF